MKTKNIIEYIILGISVFLILCCLSIFFQGIFNKDKPTKLFGYYQLEVVSWSMYNENHPSSISKGDLIFVKKNRKNEYAVGDTVTYLDENKTYITHQIIKIENDLIYTQGISEYNTAPDKPITVDQILGEVKMVWRNFDNFRNLILSPYGITAFISGSFLVYLLVNLLKKKTN